MAKIYIPAASEEDKMITGYKEKAKLLNFYIGSAVSKKKNVSFTRKL